jgi:DNA-binding response OmpR family regulator
VTDASRLPLILHVEDDEQARSSFAALHRRFAPASVLVQIEDTEEARKMMDLYAVPDLILVGVRDGERGRDFIRWARSRTVFADVALYAIGEESHFLTVLSLGGDGVLSESDVRDLFAAHLTPA